MGMIRLTGKVHLLPPSPEATVQSIIMCTIHYTPKSTISWAGPKPQSLTPLHSNILSVSTKKIIRRTQLSMDVKETPSTGNRTLSSNGQRNSLQAQSSPSVFFSSHKPHAHKPPDIREEGNSHKEISNIPRQTVKQITIWNSSSSATIPKTAHRKKIIYPPTQRTLTDTLQIRRSNVTHNSIWGHTLHEIDRSQTFQIVLQNPHSLRLFTDSISTQYSFLMCQSLAVGALCLPETNVNWDHKEAHT
jgi:hypothetical protein